MSKRIGWAVGAISCSLFALETSAQNILSVAPQGCTQLMNLPSGERSFYGQVGVGVSDWHDLQDQNKLMAVLNRGRDAGYAACGSSPPPTMLVWITASNGVGQMYAAAWDRNPGQWRVPGQDAEDSAQ